MVGTEIIYKQQVFFQVDMPCLECEFWVDLQGYVSYN